MNLNKIGQSLWLENVGRESLYSGKFRQYLEDWPISGLIIGSSAYDQALRKTSIYDDSIRKKLKNGLYGEMLALDLVLEDTCYAADLLRPVFDRTDGVDGWAVLAISPLLTADPSDMVASAKALYENIKRPNIMITIPGLPNFLKVIEDAVFAGIPINVALLFSREQYMATAESYLSGIERRIATGLKPTVGFISSISISSLATGVSPEFPKELIPEIVVALTRRIYRASRELHSSQRWERAYNAGARPQRLVWTTSSYPESDVLAVLCLKQLTAPLTVAAMTKNTLKALINHDDPGLPMPSDGGDCEEVLMRCSDSGINVDNLTTRIQNDEAALQVKVWIEVLDAVACKSAVVAQVMNDSTR
ncbi:transaldolase [Rhodopseudomonas palustris]|nr:transaldolase [Rhodopseudomonas palustris]